MQIIPLQAKPSQVLTVNLGGQACLIRLYQKSTGLFCDVFVNDTLIIGGVLCLNRNRIVRDSYLGFLGDLFIYDIAGDDDPDYTGLGSRFVMNYVPANLTIIGF